MPHDRFSAQTRHMYLCTSFARAAPRYSEWALFLNHVSSAGSADLPDLLSPHTSANVSLAARPSSNLSPLARRRSVDVGVGLRPLSSAALRATPLSDSSQRRRSIKELELSGSSIRDDAGGAAVTQPSPQQSELKPFQSRTDGPDALPGSPRSIAAGSAAAVAARVRRNSIGVTGAVGSGSGGAQMHGDWGLQEAGGGRHLPKGPTAGAAPSPPPPGKDRSENVALNGAGQHYGATAPGIAPSNIRKDQTANSGLSSWLSKVKGMWKPQPKIPAPPK